MLSKMELLCQGCQRRFQMHSLNSKTKTTYGIFVVLPTPDRSTKLDIKNSTASFGLAYNNYGDQIRRNYHNI